MIEVNIERLLVDAVQDSGGLCIKLPAVLYRGIPDRMALLPGGRIIFIELKRDKKALTKKSTGLHQARWSEILFTLGFKWCKVEGLEELKTFLKEHVHVKGPV